jgi:hypothetical protein
VIPRAGLDMVSKKKIPTLPPGIEPQPSDRPARSQSLYRVSYLGFFSHDDSNAVLYAGQKSVALSTF